MDTFLAQVDWGMVKDGGLFGLVVFMVYLEWLSKEKRLEVDKKLTENLAQLSEKIDALNDKKG